MTYGNALTKRVTLSTLHAMKARDERFTCIALYDAAMAAMAKNCGIETVLVGDSLGMTVLGHDSTLPVTMENMLYHISAVARGNTHSLIMGDMPFMSYATPAQALENAARLMQAGAHMVKLEGGTWLCETVQLLSERGIPVCAHIGLTPQSVHKFGGFKVQGRTDAQADSLASAAIALETAGADILLLECVPATVTDSIIRSVNIPTIGIGASSNTDAQVLVINDILGITPTPPKFSKNFLAEAEDIAGALAKYREDVKKGNFPSAHHLF